MRRILFVGFIAGCVLAAARSGSWAAAPVGMSAAKLQPGAEVVFPEFTCVLNFLFSGSDGQRYFASSGDCVLPEPGGLPIDEPTGEDRERTWAAGAGPVGKSPAGERIGEVVYAVDNERGAFALLRVDPRVAASPELAHFGGPTGINRDLSAEPTVIHCVGTAATGVGDVSATAPVPNARSGITFGLSHPRRASAMVPITFGDSGGPCVTADGRALGLLISAGIHVGAVDGDGGPAEFGSAGIHRLGPLLDRATAVTGVTFTLLTAPRR